MTASSDILTRYPWHQASPVPSQMPTAEEKLACQTRSGHQSAAAALHQSCSSEHSTSPWDHHPDYPELKERGFFRMGLRALDFPSTLETTHTATPDLLGLVPPLLSSAMAMPLWHYRTWGSIRWFVCTFQAYTSSLCSLTCSIESLLLLNCTNGKCFSSKENQGYEYNKQHYSSQGLLPCAWEVLKQLHSQSPELYLEHRETIWKKKKSAEEFHWKPGLILVSCRFGARLHL